MPHNHIPVKNLYAAIRFEPDYICATTAGMKNLKNIRKARGLSQVELAELAGVNQATISKIESGVMNVTLDKVHDIASALKVTPIELFGLTEEQQRALDALTKMDPAKRSAALLVLESMAAGSHSGNR